MTYSAYNGHLSRALRSATTSRSDRCCPDQSRIRETFCGTGRERGKSGEKNKAGSRRRETAAETWKASSSKGICPPFFPSLPPICHLCCSVSAPSSFAPFLIASSECNLYARRYIVLAKDVSVIILDFSTKLQKFFLLFILYLSGRELI